MADGNWLKLHRKILESRVFSDEKCLKLWVWCLCKANYKTGYFRGVEISPGSFATGRLAGSTECEISESAFYRGMKKLEEWGMIEQKANKHWTHVSICQWQTYQNPEIDSEQQVSAEANNKRTTDERRSEREADTIEEGKEREEGKEGSFALGDKPKPKPSKKQFQKPTLEEVKAYCAEKKSIIDPVKFWSWYESIGWVVGKARTPMKNWKLAIVTWERDDRDSSCQRNLFVGSKTSTATVTREEKFY